ncbi:Transposase [Burkholderia ubonensis]|nr:hypothetical protein BUB20358_01875 [Burkholderia ubonensis]
MESRIDRIKTDACCAHGFDCLHRSSIDWPTRKDCAAQAHGVALWRQFVVIGLNAMRSRPIFPM